MPTLRARTQHNDLADGWKGRLMIVYRPRLDRKPSYSQMTITVSDLSDQGCNECSGFRRRRPRRLLIERVPIPIMSSCP